MKCHGVPPATAARLPLYVRGLRQLARNRVELTSSRSLAVTTGLEAHQIRKDLSYLGTFGKRGVGYRVDDLLQELMSYLSLSHLWRVALVGYGRLGSALTSYLTDGERNFRLVAIFDCSLQTIGQNVGNLKVLSWRRIPAVCREGGVEMAIIATPPSAAQGVTTLLVEGGVRFILNFAPTRIEVPEGVVVRDVDLSAEMLALTLQTNVKKAVRSHDAAHPGIFWPVS